jgi:DNA repair photolyase
MEPRTSRPVRRLAAVEGLAAAAASGASFAAYVPLRLPGAVRLIFEDWLERHFPDRREKVLNRIRSMRGGRLNDPEFGSRMRGEGVFAEQGARLFDVSCRRVGIGRGRFPKLSADAFCRPGEHPTLFD